ncbi:hypothetical protein GCM10010924_21160 [Rhizobium wenxiniae]|uniref:Uncharacterized protein n=1 Tax=Rhizobium wenxiniae TaxID=1737357 RepID=A0A7W9Y6Z2_9HYPH|nr:hypothetical protein [Rhizobium wenxiniae]MBB6163171.1 hypothetical protein [Rhizobium wenxiniae]GGF92914.1 hypothetical protein GCM10010924_21160 [Rhizobium wenxiniae]
MTGSLSSTATSTASRVTAGTTVAIAAISRDDNWRAFPGNTFVGGGSCALPVEIKGQDAQKKQQRESGCLEQSIRSDGVHDDLSSQWLMQAQDTSL